MNGAEPSLAPRITLVHGWGGDASLWREVVPLLAGLDVEVADLGFFGRPAAPAPCAAPRIAVGHSLGALWWLALTDLPWRTLVAINGFPHFTAADDFPHGVPPRVLERMRRRFAATPAGVLAEFRAACGGMADAPALPTDVVPLADGLGLLAATDGRAALAKRADDVWALATRDDAIVPAAMSAAAFAALMPQRLRWLDAGGHLLPLSQPKECAALIRAAANA
jgi:pimeloyl-[acyl-carrier protein] methyl ester esterase